MPHPKPTTSPIKLLAAAAIYGGIVDPRSGAGGLNCLWLWLSGHECPGCGLSRALSWLVRGDLESAVAANWLIAPLAAAVAVDMFTTITSRRSPQETPHG